MYVFAVTFNNIVFEPIAIVAPGSKPQMMQINSNAHHSKHSCIIPGIPRLKNSPTPSKAARICTPVQNVLKIPVHSMYDINKSGRLMLQNVLATATPSQPKLVWYTR
mmetsp:Transcript_21339/g.48471  ORF Transcript_21339/g.48471 Transcript_21339/m.48471 type:complete len:107 (+) Transcript_21339:641-961(+)